MEFTKEEWDNLDKSTQDKHILECVWRGDILNIYSKIENVE